MMACNVKRQRNIRPLAALVLVIQGLAGGAVALAHANERETAPAAFEAHHNASCVVIHDALRCALCWYAGSLITPPVTLAGQCAAAITQRPGDRDRAVAATPASRQPLPRAPPVPLS
ncbi:MAG TPA: hypothetical protein VLV15_00865 [Dongiaceae bacterium]|nr:hypothetical protein [Dongiaceae bacterium]